MTTGSPPAEHLSKPRGPAASGFGDRLRTYLIGVGIGISLLGMFWLMKQRAAQTQGIPADAPVPGSVLPANGLSPSGN